MLAVLLTGSALVLAGGAGWVIRRRRVPADVRAARRAEREYRAGAAHQETGRRIAKSIHPDFIRDWMR